MAEERLNELLANPPQEPDILECLLDESCMMPRIFSFCEVRQLLFKAIQNERRIWFKEEFKNEKNKVISKEIINNHWDEFLHAYYKQKCNGCGSHNSFWATIIESESWKAWQEEQRQRMARGKIVDGKFSEMCYDMDEVCEGGFISENHWKEFLQFIKQL